MAPSRALFRIVAICRYQHCCLKHARSIRSIHQYRRYSPPRVAEYVRPQETSATYRRFYSTSDTASLTPPEYLKEAELAIFNKLNTELKPIKLEVQDVSGGCGSMYAIEIESPMFQGMTVIKQHKLVNKVLEEEIKKWHGVQLRTKAT